MNYKNILITGATSGFGRATAELLAHAGYQIIATGRRKDRLTELSSKFSNIHTFELDVQKRSEIENLYDELKSKNLLPDVIINNAGLALGLEKAHNADLDQWEQVIDTNIKGLTFITRIFLPHLVTQNSGYIINIGSIAGTYPYPGGNVYGGTKAFVNHFSLNLRADLLGTNIRVTSIEPGACETEFSLVRFKGDQEKAANTYKGMKPIVSEDIAGIMKYLIELPPHININSLEVMPIQQAWAPLAMHRNSNQ